MNSESLNSTQVRRGRMVLATLALLFGLPFVAAVWFFLHPDMLPAGTVNRGTLVQPPVAVGRAAGLGLEGYWTIGYLTPDPCDAACGTRIHQLGQARLATGVERDRVRRLVLHPGDQVPPVADSRIVVDAAQAWRPLPGGLEPGAYFMVDPMGRLMMTYAPDQPADDLLKDLQRLLKVSKEWTVNRGR